MPSTTQGPVCLLAALGISKEQLHIVSPQVAATPGAGWVALLCFYPEGIWLEGEPQNAVGKQSEEGPLMELGWGDAHPTMA